MQADEHGDFGFPTARREDQSHRSRQLLLLSLLLIRTAALKWRAEVWAAPCVLRMTTVFQATKGFCSLSGRCKVVVGEAGATVTISEGSPQLSSHR